ncbi:ATP-binding protein [Tessaracoccus sp. ZS01]|uniref:ATP-binding protein n=1 Tax=Tessaracoccus sp. ZS01 TaxID=1906324 RepID=UPI00096FF537|nr:AAA family ATPase [Tessaracoccus sp. ZS01]MCG6568784.1 ATP-binding protein [Tessaracoccus sp. ZS01]OMG51645.1 AAA family ATPase [Tessaracoccus sp. ZS01]
MEYARRILDDELDELFGQVPAIAVDGPKGVGKTTTAEQRVAGVVRLDSRAIRESIAAEPEQVLGRGRSLLIDEWQKVPEVWDVVRRAVDADPTGGQFLLVGSASPAPGATAHSGAGRIGRLRMRPMTLSERGVTQPTVSLRGLLGGDRGPLSGSCSLTLSDYVEEIVASGFPAMRSLVGRSQRFQLDSYLRNAVDRDVPEQGLAVRKPEAMLAWLRAYAAATATTASYAQILDAATPGQGDKPARSTSIAYRDVLSSLWLLDPVPAWAPSGSLLTRLGQTPKHHLADPALAARLLGLSRDALLDGVGTSVGPQSGSVLGHLFESLVTLCVRVPAQAAEATVRHLRTRNGDHEVDLVVVRDDGRALAVEIKLANTVTDQDTKHLHWLADRMGDKLLDAIVINTGPNAYRRPDGIAVLPLGLLAP